MHNATRIEVLSQIVAFAQLPQTVALEMRQIEGIRHDSYLTWVGHVTQTLSKVNFDNNLTAYVSPITPDMVGLIDICDDHLCRSRFAEDPLDPERIKNLHQDTVSLAKDVSASEIEPKIKEYILYHLRIVECAINDYRVQGRRAFETALDSSVGAVIVRRPLAAEARDSEFGNRLAIVLAAFVLTCDAKEHAKSLYADARLLLPSATVDVESNDRNTVSANSKE